MFLGSSCILLLLLSLDPRSSSRAVISAPWSLSWLPQGMGQTGLASYLSGLWISAFLSIFGCQLWLGLHLAPGSGFCAPGGAWAGRDPVASWAAQRANLPCRAQSTCVLLVYTGFLGLIFGMFLWCSQQHFGILAGPEVKQIEPALSF